MAATNWRCPFCEYHVTIVGERTSAQVHRIFLPSKHGNQAIQTFAIACPNEGCKELYVRVTMNAFTRNGTVNYDQPTHSGWTLRPDGSSRVFPEYVPLPIREDYREACLIRDRSAKASATLSRRCLQGMIRDFWGITKDNLFEEIKALKDKVDSETWAAIDAVRKIGNVGAHMEKDINTIVDVDPGEAELLTGLIETLIEDWYIERHNRAERSRKLVEAAAGKKPVPKPPEPEAE